MLASSRRTGVSRFRRVSGSGWVTPAVVGMETRWWWRRPYFNGKASYQGSSDELVLVERFTRIGAETITYEYTITDPTIYVRPWTAALDLKPLEGDMYEFACHEGNYGMEGILAGARADEKAAVQSMSGTK